MAVEASDPMLCCVTPIAYRNVDTACLRDHLRDFFQSFLGKAQVLAANSTVNGARLFLYFSNPFTH